MGASRVRACVCACTCVSRPLPPTHSPPSLIAGSIGDFAESQTRHLCLSRSASIDFTLPPEPLPSGPRARCPLFISHPSTCRCRHDADASLPCVSVLGCVRVCRAGRDEFCEYLTQVGPSSRSRSLGCRVSGFGFRVSGFGFRAFQSLSLSSSGSHPRSLPNPVSHSSHVFFAGTLSLRPARPAPLLVPATPPPSEFLRAPAQIEGQLRAQDAPFAAGARDEDTEQRGGSAPVGGGPEEDNARGRTV